MEPKVQVAINDCVQKCLMLAAKAHQWHLATRNGFTHLTLGDLYEYFHVAADKLSESAQGAGLNPSASRGKLSLEFTSAESAISETEAFIGELESLRGMVSAMPWYDSIVQEVQGSLYDILYKLKRLS
jgi:hypothetical protein